MHQCVTGVLGDIYIQILSVLVDLSTPQKFEVTLPISKRCLAQLFRVLTSYSNCELCSCLAFHSFQLTSDPGDCHCCATNISGF